MQKRKWIVVLLLVVVLAITSIAFVACNDDNDAPPVEYTVTFDSADGGNIAPQKVKSGETATEPSPAPEKSNYDFKGWYLGEIKYDFSTPVTQDITLTAKWELTPPTQYTFTFDSNGGSEIESVTVEDGVVIVKPKNPTRAGYYFEGWYEGETKFEFNQPLTRNVTVTAKWSDANEIDSAFLSALAADYSNFTSTSVLTDKTGSDTYIFQQAGNLAYYNPVGMNIFQEHIMVFDENGYLVSMYYLNDDEWLKSGLITCADFIVPLYLDEIELSDVSYNEGVYRVYDESVDSVVYALFRSTDSYTDFYIQVEDGHISKVWGTIASDETFTHVQTFDDFGTTEIILPDNLPAVTVDIVTKTKETEEGLAMDLDELINFLFTVKVEGKNYTINSDMVDLDGLNLSNPVEGVYNVVLTFETWDGVSHTETTTVTVKTVQAEETFADIFAKDYSNATISSTSATFKYADGVYLNPSNTNILYFAEADGTLTKYQYSPGSGSGSGWNATSDVWLSTVVRVDLLFALNSNLFEQVDDSNVYVAKNNEELIPVLSKLMLLATYKFNTLRDYSITLTVNAGRVEKIDLSFYTVTASTTPTATNGTANNKSFTLSDFGTTEIDVPDEVVAMRNGTADASAQTAYFDDKKYIA